VSAVFEYGIMALGDWAWHFGILWWSDLQGFESPSSRVLDFFNQWHSPVSQKNGYLSCIYPRVGYTNSSQISINKRHHYVCL